MAYALYVVLVSSPHKPIQYEPLRQYFFWAINSNLLVDEEDPETKSVDTH
jgi:hypothetical protein